MARVVGTYGLQHKPNELVVNIECNLEELYDMLALYHNDGFSRDIRDAIEAIEQREPGSKR